MTTEVITNQRKERACKNMKVNSCILDKSELHKTQTVTDHDHGVEWDVYECPKCQMCYALHWHPLGEPAQPVAAVAA